MKSRHVFSLFFVAMILLALPGAVTRAQERTYSGNHWVDENRRSDGCLSHSTAEAVSAAFTYQGYLSGGSGPADGRYDFLFALYDAGAGGNLLGSIAKEDTPVSKGYFTVVLDYGAGVFNGEARWLEIGVRPAGEAGEHTSLSPRQALTAAPYASYALNADAAARAGSAPWSGLEGIPAGFADGVDNDTLYDAGSGLLLDGTIFSVDTDFTDGRYWMLGGNPLTADGVLGVTSSYGLDFRVNDARALRLEPHATSPNIIGGYSGNWVEEGVYGAVIGGGGNYSYANRVTGNYGVVSGGRANRAHGSYAFVGGGFSNGADGDYAAVGGGRSNFASGNYATVGGGRTNFAYGDHATIAGGYNNYADGYASTVGGGRDNTANGNYSFVAGHFAKNTDPEHQGVFLFADSNENAFLSTAANQFRVRATGGVEFVTGIDLDGNPTAGAALAAGSGTWSSTSDRSLKENFSGVDGREVLAKVAGLPIQTWNYIAQGSQVRHIGPTAQDFYAAFSVGEDDLHIAAVDADGVALAAIQGLNEILREKETQIEALEARLAALERGASAGQAVSPLSTPWPWLALCVTIVAGAAILRKERA